MCPKMLCALSIDIGTCIATLLLVTSLLSCRLNLNANKKPLLVLTLMLNVIQQSPLVRVIASQSPCNYQPLFSMFVILNTLQEASFAYATFFSVALNDFSEFEWIILPDISPTIDVLEIDPFPHDYSKVIIT